MFYFVSAFSFWILSSFTSYPCLHSFLDCLQLFPLPSLPFVYIASVSQSSNHWLSASEAPGFSDLDLCFVILWAKSIKASLKSPESTQRFIMTANLFFLVDTILFLSTAFPPFFSDRCRNTCYRTFRDWIEPIISSPTSLENGCSTSPKHDRSPRAWQFIFTHSLIHSNGLSHLTAAMWKLGSDMQSGPQTGIISWV